MVSVGGRLGAIGPTWPHSNSRASLRAKVMQRTRLRNLSKSHDKVQDSDYKLLVHWRTVVTSART